MDLLVRLYDLPSADAAQRELAERGVTVRGAMPYERQQVVQWVREQFSAGWASECECTFALRPPSCVIATRDGRLLGFACYEASCRDFVGPMGVLESEHRGGIGRVLLLSALHALAAMGYAYAIIGGVGPVEFYHKVAGAVPIEGSTPGIYRDMLKTD